VVLFVGGVGLALSGAAAAETLDIATFTPPPGWQRVDNIGSVTFGTLDAVAQKFGVVTVFASVPSSGDPTKDFAAASGELVPGVAVAQKQEQPTSQGFVGQYGAAQTVENGVTGVTLVVTITARDRVVRILAKTNLPEHLKSLDAMVAGLRIGAGTAP